MLHQGSYITGLLTFTGASSAFGSCHRGLRNVGVRQVSLAVIVYGLNGPPSTVRIISTHRCLALRLLLWLSRPGHCALRRLSFRATSMTLH